MSDAASAHRPSLWHAPGGTLDASYARTWHAIRGAWWRARVPQRTTDHGNAIGALPPPPPMPSPPRVFVNFSTRVGDHRVHCVNGGDSEHELCLPSTYCPVWLDWAQWCHPPQFRATLRGATGVVGGGVDSGRGAQRVAQRRSPPPVRTFPVVLLH